MYLVYFPGFQGVTGECSVTPIRRQSLLNDAGVQFGFRERWSVRGFLQDVNPAALTADIAALENAFVTGGSQIALYNDDGSASAHGINSSSTLGGLHVLELSFPVGEGAEYSTFRTFEAVIEFEYRYPLPGLLSWTESIVYTGGAAAIVALEPINGPAQIQQVKQQTAYRAIQSGHAKGQFSYPIPSAPNWPLNLEAAPDIREVAPQKFGLQQYADYETSWTYRFVSATPLIGNPNPWPLGQ